MVVRREREKKSYEWLDSETKKGEKKVKKFLRRSVSKLKKKEGNEEEEKKKKSSLGRFGKKKTRG